MAGQRDDGAGAPLASDPQNVGAAFDGINGAGHGIVTTGLSGGVPGAGTILAWVNLAALPSVNGAIQYIAGESTSGNDFDLQFTGDNVLRFYTGSGENTAYAPDMATLVGQWHLIGATYDATMGAGSFRNLYWDGSLAASFVGGVNAAAKSSTLTIGYSSVFGNREFNGLIDEVAVFDHALTAGQMAAIYDARLVAGSPGAIPEPSSWAIMVGGLAFAGGMMRRRIMQVGCAAA